MRRAGKRVLWSLSLVLGIVVLGLVWWSSPRPLASGALPRHQPDVANGERLFHAGGCASCHGEDLAGGLELDTPFGRFYVPNISPHPVAGIGGWSDVDFANAMLRGVSPDGRHYYPAFPYTAYAGMSLTDVADLRAWLATYQPAADRVASHQLGFPWNIRPALGVWKRFYLDPSPVVERANGGERFLRGRYLVEVVGHCGECHSPRGIFGAVIRSRWLAGAPSLEGEGRVPNITPHEDGLGDWSAKDFERYFRSGFTPDYDTVGGAMVAVQENLARLDDDDRAAIADYLLAVPPLPDAGD